MHHEQTCPLLCYTFYKALSYHAFIGSTKNKHMHKFHDQFKIQTCNIRYSRLDAFIDRKLNDYIRFLFYLIDLIYDSIRGD